MVKLVKDRFCILFPGQGVQFPGMIQRLKNCEAAQRILHEGEKKLGKPLLHLFDSSQKGTTDLLNQTINAQPAVFLSSLAFLESFKEFTKKKGLPFVPKFYAGHSLGQITALVASQALDWDCAIELVERRAHWMHEASLETPGALLAILGLDLSQVHQVLESSLKKGVLVVANYNGPGQYILSGETPAIESVQILSENMGAKKAVVLKITTASHSPLMRSAQEKLNPLIDRLKISPPSVPVVLNTSGEITTNPDCIRSELKNHLCKSVQWEKTIQLIWEKEVDTFLDIGPGALFEKMTGHQIPQAKAASLGFLQSFERTLEC